MVAESTKFKVASKPRIEGAIQDLENCIATFEAKPGESLELLKETEEWQLAQTQITEANVFIEAMMDI